MHTNLFIYTCIYTGVKQNNSQTQALVSVKKIYHIPYIIPRYLTFKFDCNYHRENFAIFRLNGRQDGIERIITLFYKTLSTK